MLAFSVLQGCPASYKERIHGRVFNPGPNRVLARRCL